MKTITVNFSNDIVQLINSVPKEEIENALRRAFPEYLNGTEEKGTNIREFILERFGKQRPEPTFGIDKSIEMIRNQNFLNFDPEE
jgi:hypothetical protein